jgi:hypothetical protein
MHKLGDIQEWGADEVRIYTLRGWVICAKRGEFKKGRFRNEIEEELSSLPTVSHIRYQSNVRKGT